VQTEQAPECPKNPLHTVHRLLKPQPKVLRILHAQEAPTVRLVKAEDPPWWCERCGLPVAADW
jgi:hypothetical protein